MPSVNHLTPDSLPVRKSVRAIDDTVSGHPEARAMQSRLFNAMERLRDGEITQHEIKELVNESKALNAKLSAEVSQ